MQGKLLGAHPLSWMIFVGKDGEKDSDGEGDGDGKRDGDREVEGEGERGRRR